MACQVMFVLPHRAASVASTFTCLFGRLIEIDMPSACDALRMEYMRRREQDAIWPRLFSPSSLHCRTGVCIHWWGTRAMTHPLRKFQTGMPMGKTAAAREAAWPVYGFGGGRGAGCPHGPNEEQPGCASHLRLRMSKVATDLVSGIVRRCSRHTSRSLSVPLIIGGPICRL
ncbi:unnamed protein product [Mycena citricolor]|uniref:Uncharacterized protein n=1 Tax=Mycena citricolor TaxID=2018698 RepID=A0AAD2GU49_9AGAR|nr:unnamed protein product [Mycena citricolor]CAK5263205.1 unnamed protein product [Mycena citricolor]